MSEGAKESTLRVKKKILLEAKKKIKKVEKKILIVFSCYFECLLLNFCESSVKIHRF